MKESKEVAYMHSIQDLLDAISKTPTNTAARGKLTEALAFALVLIENNIKQDKKGDQ